MYDTNDIISTIRANLDFFVGSRDEADIARTAERWEGLDIEGWLAAAVCDAGRAAKLEAAGIAPSDVEAAGVGREYANGDMSLAEVEAAIAAL